MTQLNSLLQGKKDHEEWDDNYRFYMNQLPSKPDGNMSRLVRKPAVCICENKDADQLCGNHKADQRLCFHYIGSTIPLLPKYEI